QHHIAAVTEDHGLAGDHVGGHHAQRDAHLLEAVALQQLTQEPLHAGAAGDAHASDGPARHIREGHSTAGLGDLAGRGAADTGDAMNRNAVLLEERRSRRCAPGRARTLRPAPRRGAWEREPRPRTSNCPWGRPPGLRGASRTRAFHHSGWTTIILDAHSFRQVSRAAPLLVPARARICAGAFFRHAGDRAIAQEADGARQRAANRGTPGRREYGDSGVLRARPPDAHGLSIAHARRRRAEPDWSGAGRFAGADSFARI